jgi:hypothetical protein
MSVAIDAAPHAVQNCPRCELGVAKTEGGTRFCAGCGLRWEVVASARRKQRRIGKRKLTQLSREMSEATNEMPLEWLMRQDFSRDLEAHCGNAGGGQSADSKNVQHSQACRLRSAQDCSGMKFFKRVHMRTPREPPLSLEPAEDQKEVARRLRGDDHGPQ